MSDGPSPGRKRDNVPGDGMETKSEIRAGGQHHSFPGDYRSTENIWQVKPRGKSRQTSNSLGALHETMSMSMSIPRGQ